jgi:DNA-binding NarL/FixJ family response regulator
LRELPTLIVEVYMTPPNPSEKIKIMLVDDHVLMRMGLTFALNNQPDMEVVGEAEDGVEAIDMFRKCSPDVTILDLRMPKKNGVETITQLRQTFGPVNILVLSNYGTSPEIGAAIQAGARGFLTKDTPLTGLANAIRQVRSGEQYLSPDVARRLAGRVLTQLSPREVEVLALIGKGLSNKEVGSQLNVAEATVKGHVTSLLSKLGVSDRTQAILAGIKRGIIQLD